MAKEQGSIPQGEMSTAQAIDALAKAIIAQTPAQRDPLDMAGISKERKNVMQGLEADGSPLKPRRWRAVPGKSPFTGSTFTMVVIESRSKRHPLGRVTELRDYKHPAGMYKHEDDGGLAPNGLRIFAGDQQYLPDDVEPTKQMLTQEFQSFRWAGYYQKDLLWVGESGVFSAAWCVDPKGVDTPWQEGAPAQEDAG